MRMIFRICLVLPVLMAASAAQAIEPDAPDRLIDHDEAVGIVVRQTLDGEAPASTEYGRHVQKSLAGFYSARASRPLWVTRDGLNARAKAAIAEIERADQYGLEPKKFKLPTLAAGTDHANPPTAELARAELMLSHAVLTYAWHAKGGRVDPRKLSRNLDRGPTPPDPGEVMVAMASADDAAAFLRGLHPKHAQFEKLRQKYNALRRGRSANERITIPPGPKLEQGVTHSQVALLRKRLNVHTPTKTGNPEFFDAKLADAVRAMQKAHGLKVDGVVGNGTRRALNRRISNGEKVQRLLINMERWRWMPENLGGDAGQYVWVNIPEFRVRVVQDGKIKLTERVITGKVTHQTPVFSDEMEWVEFHPVWYVPNSIKIKEILPYLKNSDRILERHDLRMRCPRGVGRTGGGGVFGGGSWSGDIRRCSFTQPPSAKNVLGFFKFKFPNKHSVYLHDTPQRYLFVNGVRTFSHGCVRVRNPQRLAELILGKDQGMTASRISAIVKGPRVTRQQILKKRVPVHITYFTARVTDSGKLVFFGDYYGHDRRIGLALNGKATRVAAGASEPRGPRTRVAGNGGSGRSRTWVSGAFSQAR